MSSWISPTITFGINLSNKNIFELTYIRHYFKGSEVIQDRTWYNGTLYAPSSRANIQRTIYMGFEGVWKARIFHSSKTNIFLRTAIDYERLKFYVDAPVDEQSPKSETYEVFSKQQLPLPTIGLYANHKLSLLWSIHAEAFGTYLPITETWMNEGGTMQVGQANTDMKVYLKYQRKMLSFSPPRPHSRSVKVFTVK